jgi:hypothetical protein
MRRSLVIFGALTMAASSSAVSAQMPASVPLKHTVISVQPLSAMIAVYAVEIEQTVGAAMSLGVGGTFWSPGFAGQDMTYTSGDLKLRYYPQGRALEGFAFAMSAGFTHIKDKSTNVVFGTGTSEHTASGPTIGANIEYNWLLGRNNGFFLGLGVGAKRIIAKADNMSDDVKFAYPTARISIGAAF